MGRNMEYRFIIIKCFEIQSQTREEPLGDDVRRGSSHVGKNWVEHKSRKKSIMLKSSPDTSSFCITKSTQRHKESQTIRRVKSLRSTGPDLWASYWKIWKKKKSEQYVMDVALGRSGSLSRRMMMSCGQMTFDALGWIWAQNAPENTSTSINTSEPVAHNRTAAIVWRMRWRVSGHERLNFLLHTFLFPSFWHLTILSILR